MLGTLLEKIFQKIFHAAKHNPCTRNQPLMQNETQAVEMFRRFASKIHSWSKLKHQWSHITSTAGKTAMAVLCPTLLSLHYPLQPQCRKKAQQADTWFCCFQTGICGPTFRHISWGVKQLYFSKLWRFVSEDMRIHSSSFQDMLIQNSSWPRAALLAKPCVCVDLNIVFTAGRNFSWKQCFSSMVFVPLHNEVV